MELVMPYVWLHIHVAFAGMAIFGAIAALLYLSKHAKKKGFLAAVWTTVIVGVIGMVLTAGQGVDEVLAALATVFGGN